MSAAAPSRLLCVLPAAFSLSLPGSTFQSPLSQAPLLPGLLRALVERLEGADESAMVQSLLCVLAQLLRADQAQLLDCLAGTKLRWARCGCGQVWRGHGPACSSLGLPDQWGVVVGTQRGGTGLVVGRDRSEMAGRPCLTGN